MNSIMSIQDYSTATPTKTFKKESSLYHSSAKIYDEFKIEFEKPVNFVVFGTFDNCYDILACSVQERVLIYRILLLDQYNDEELKFDYQLIHDYILGSKCTCITFSPNTDFSQISQGFLSLAIAGEDFGISILNQLFSDKDSPNQHTKQFHIHGHSDFINDLAFEPISGNYLASASDDCTCCVWPLTDDNEIVHMDMKIILSSPGINVKWHKSEPNKLFVAEKRGLIRFYDTKSRVAVMSFDCNRYPLLSSDWCHENSSYIGCCSGKDIFFWDTSLTSLPIKVIKTNSEGLSEFKFYDSKLIAFRGRPNNFLQIQNCINNQIYMDKEFIAGHGLCWNIKLPILAVGGPKAVHLIKMNVF